MSHFQEQLEKYAELAVKVGVNIQTGQTLFINTALNSVDFIRLIVKKAYEAGAKNVIVNWNDDIVSRLKYDLAPDEVFHEFPKWRAKEMEELAEQGTAFMSVVSSSPDLLKGEIRSALSTFKRRRELLCTNTANISNQIK